MSGRCYEDFEVGEVLRHPLGGRSRLRTIPGSRC